MHLDTLISRLNKLQEAGCIEQLRHIKRGIEREALRVTPEGALSQKPHPKELGAPLCHPHITTDFSEAQIELVTAPQENLNDMLQELQDIHAFVASCLGEERLWPLSMPCSLSTTTEIPIAHYGTSHLAHFKQLYRTGLQYRYGAAMQTISGIHYNLSLSDQFWLNWGQCNNLQGSLVDIKNIGYLHIARNFQRFHWVLLYFLGNSPMTCDDMAGSLVSSELVSEWPYGGLYNATATSLRNSDIGYSTEAQPEIKLDYSDITAYTRTLQQAITDIHAPWQKLQNRFSTPIQLGCGKLQIENELYAPIRIKPAASRSARPVRLLKDNGVEYIEIRCIDLNHTAPAGITEDACRLIDLLILYCLCLPAPEDGDGLRTLFLNNNQAVALRGQILAQTLANADNSSADEADEWQRQLRHICEGMALIAEVMPHERTAWIQAAQIATEQASGQQPIPSCAQLAAAQQQQHSLLELGLEHALAHHRHWQTQHTDALNQRMTQLSQNSVIQKEQLEQNDQAHGQSFAEYCRQYFTP
ncbi:MAG: hypothetical protein ACR2PW_02475 [Gammaproteobacteria bacterium]